MATIHPTFVSPENKQARIWRYMDFTKYVWLLQKQALFFSRADLLADPFEGSYSRANKALRPVVYKNMFDEIRTKNEPIKAHELIQSFEDVYQFCRHLRKWTYVNCWHMNDYESAAMWKLYSKTSEAIAVQSTYQRLFDCLPQETYVGIVKYIDYDRDWLPEGNTFSPFLHKQMSFKHEQEIRAITTDIKSLGSAQNAIKENPEAGHSIPVRLDSLIETIYVSPDSPTWFFQLVREVSDVIGLNKPVIQSSLKATPFF